MSCRHALLASRRCGIQWEGRSGILAPERAARTILWLVINDLVAEDPGINVDLMISGRLIDIVSERFDAGVRIGEELAMHMVAIPIGPELRMAAVASPDYFRRYPVAQTATDLASHSSIGYRRSETGAVYSWEFAKDGQRLKARPRGQLVFNDAVFSWRPHLPDKG
jgi:DNA-binding transcriptional LysR family regulator